MTEKNRPAYTAGLRAVAEFLDAHPEVPLPFLGSAAEGSSLPCLDIYLMVHSSDQKTLLAAVARAMGTATKATADYGDGSSRFQVWREFGGIVLCAHADRDRVCTRVVTGTEDREVEETVTPAVTRKVVKAVEVVEWKCEPLLASDPAPEPAPSLVECAKCHLIGTPADMDPVAYATAGGERGTHWYCKDMTACSDRAVPGLAGHLAQAERAETAGGVL